MTATGTTTNGPALVDAITAARFCGISRAKWWELHSSGRVPAPIRALGPRCPRWRMSELLDWIDHGCPSREIWEKRSK
jgi:predicted DNA-binding transcriptional regulator AlpA